jgi:hypothetical protein
MCQAQGGSIKTPGKPGKMFSANNLIRPGEPNRTPIAPDASEWEASSAARCAREGSPALAAPTPEGVVEDENANSPGRQPPRRWNAV